MNVDVDLNITRLLDAGTPLAIGVSGGKDSVACAAAVADYVFAIGYTGPKVLVHSDLGSVEWQASLSTCEKLAEQLGWELLVVRRQSGGMMERWESRWESSVRRYLALECVKVILPWSTPAMRFCTAELKRDVIYSALRKRWPKQPIVSVTGIRADESPNRAKQPVARPAPRLSAGSWDWNAILTRSKAEVLRFIDARGLPLHEAYTKFGASRVSCVFCIMSTPADLLAGLSDSRNVEIYERMCELELDSGFAFQGGKWLLDLRSNANQKMSAETAKRKAARRLDAEKWIPKDLEFTKGWPHRMPTHSEAVTLADVRGRICEIYHWAPTFATPAEVLARYAELLKAKHDKSGS